MNRKRGLRVGLATVIIACMFVMFYAVSVLSDWRLLVGATAVAIICASVMEWFE